ncbi:hypothetical protein [Granulosicoccus antarcticus]|uniref:Uncharacterized protein n=1 Tax=Granulosicoccus antarcticus IMCC3135 TaxID=1192854 RepID=A0A2Z2NYM6_9GAMM|nr:hypothetical protein [Granulosicoccus antarcticus]ASJ76542.1 hypothetical protein IMCC3135_32485 [Granulosicoccus antarcticus IMCC3135]
MNQTTLLLAVACLVTGLATGYASARVLGQPEQSRPPAGSSPTQDRLAQTEQSKAAARNSPFAVIGSTDSDTPFSHLAHPQKKTDSSSSGMPLGDATLSDYRVMLAVLQDIDSADSEQIRNWISTTSTLSGDDPDRRIVERALFQRWSQLAPDAVVQWLKQQSDYVSAYSQHNLLRSAVAGYALQWPEAAGKWLLDLDSSDPDTALLLQFMAESIGRIDPADILDKLKDVDENGYIHTVMYEWAQQDPEAALEWTENNGSTEQQSMFKDMILTTLLDRDPEAALAHINALPETSQHRWILSQYASRVAQTDPDKAIQWVMSQNDLDVQEQALMEISWMWPQDDMAGLQFYLDSVQDSEQRDRLYSAVAEQMVSAMANDDPAAAMIWLDELAPEVQRRARPVAFDRWLASDSTSALAWLKQQPESDEKRAILDMSIWSLPEQDLDFTLDNFSQLSRNVKVSVAAQIINALDNQRPAYLEQWVAQIDDTEVQQAAQAALQDRIAVRDVDGFLATLETASGDDRAERLAVLFRSLNTSNSERLQTWLIENPLSMQDERALQRQQEKVMSAMSSHC